jgi:hypothetical protein
MITGYRVSLLVLVNQCHCLTGWFQSQIQFSFAVRGHGVITHRRGCRDCGWNLELVPVLLSPRLRLHGLNKLFHCRHDLPQADDPPLLYEKHLFKND